MTRSEDFKVFYNEFLITYAQFCLNEIMHKEISGEPFTKFKETWATILLGLEKAYLLGLARIFERPKELDKTISIYYFFDYELVEYEKTINKIRNLRNKFLAHLDLKTIHKRDSFLKENHLTREEIRSLFEKTAITINNLSKNFEQKDDLKSQFDRLTKEIQEQFRQWYTFFKS